MLSAACNACREGMAQVITLAFLYSTTVLRARILFHLIYHIYVKHTIAIHIEISTFQNVR